MVTIQELPSSQDENLAAVAAISLGDDDNNNQQTTPQEEDWSELMGSDLMIKIITQGSEEGIEPQDAVKIDVIGRRADDKEHDNGPIFQELKDVLMVVGEKDVLPALEMGVRFMKVGQTAWIWSHSKYAFGPSTRKHEDYELPEYSNVLFCVTLKSIASAEEFATPSFQMDLAKSKKNLGNDVYKNEWPFGMDRAIRLYQRSAVDMENWILNHTDDIDNKTEATNIMLDCLNNIVAAYMRAKDYHKAKEAAVKVLTIDADNFKALVRAAKASMMDPAATFEEAEAAIAAAESVKQDDADVIKLRQELKRRKQEYKKKSKEMYSNMMTTDNN